VKIVVKHDLLPIPIRTMDWCAFDDDRIDGAPDAPITMQRQGFGATSDEAMQELVSSACEDYTPEELAEGEADALAAGDVHTLVFITLVRELVGA
jgi:hypothetical protein